MQCTFTITLPESLERAAVILGLSWWLGGKDFCQHRAAGRAGSIPGLGKPPGEGIGNPLQYSHLGNPLDKGAWQAVVHGVAKSRILLSMHAGMP